MISLLCLSLGLMAADVPGFADAQWIAPPVSADPMRDLPLVRKEFLVEGKPRRAMLRIIGLGDFDASVNGKRVAPTGINQPWSQYEKAIYTQDFDISHLVRAGANCVGVALTNSFWHNPNPPKRRYNKDGPQRAAEEPLLLRAEVRLESDGGELRTIGTDPSWKTSPGPIAFSHIFAGEDYDARREQRGWDRAGFDDGGWKAMRAVAGPSSEIRPRFWPMIQDDGKAFQPESVKPFEGGYTYSFPQNAAAQLRVWIEGGKPGDVVEFKSGEHRSPEGKLFGHYDVATKIVTDGGKIDRRWTSFYLGMQFVEAMGAVPAGEPNPKGLPVIRRMELIPVRTAMATTGTFRSSSQVLNDTHRIVDWAMRANSSHVLTDCPHREKLGWLECAHLLAPTFLYRYDSAAWFDKIFRDVADAQEPNGNVQTVAPSYPAGRFPGAFTYTVEWGAAATLGPWELYKWTGDRAGLASRFETMRRYTDWISANAKDGVAPGGLGDWYDYGHGQPPGASRFTPVELSATAMWAMCADAVCRAAEALGRSGDAAKYRALHVQIAKDFQRHFRDPSTGKIRNTGSPQCGNAMALCADIVPSADRPRLVQEIVDDLEKRGWQQTPGDIGHVYFIRALAEAGRSDVLHKVYARDGLGSYGGIAKKGLTSMPETWDAMMDGYQSLNHCMLGHVMEWLYGYVGGIRQAPGSVGWSRVVVAPVPGSLTEGSASVQTPKGRVQSKWTARDGKFRLEARVPEGMEAEAVLPSGKRVRLRGGNQTLSEAFPPSG